MINSIISYTREKTEKEKRKQEKIRENRRE